MNDLIAGITGMFDIESDKLKFSPVNMAITLAVIVGSGLAMAGVELGLDAMNDGIQKKKAESVEPAAA